MNEIKNMNETPIELTATSKSISVGATSNTCYICLEPISTLLEDPVKPFTCDHPVCGGCSNSLFTTPATKKCGICRNENIRGIDMILRIGQSFGYGGTATILRQELEEARYEYNELRERHRVARLRIQSLLTDSRGTLPQNLPPSQNSHLLFPPFPTTENYWTTHRGRNPIHLGWNGGREIRGIVSIGIRLGNQAEIQRIWTTPEHILRDDIELTRGIQFEARRRQDQFIEVRCNRAVDIVRQYQNDAVGEIRGQNRKEIFKHPDPITGVGEWRRFRILRRENGSEYIQLNNTWRFLEIDATKFRECETLEELIGENPQQYGDYDDADL